MYNRRYVNRVTLSIVIVFFIILNSYEILNLIKIEKNDKKEFSNFLEEKAYSTNSINNVTYNNIMNNSNNIMLNYKKEKQNVMLENKIVNSYNVNSYDEVEEKGRL